MKKISFFVLALLAVFTSAQAQSYTVDAQKSVLEWTGEKVTGEHFGKLLLSSGSFTIENGKLTAGTFDVDMNSITCDDMTDETYNQKLVGHLKSDDFFGVATYPKATFTVTEAATISGGSATVKGDLTIKGKTAPVEFRAVFQETADAMKVYGKVVVDRTVYDVRYGSTSFFDSLGDKTIYDEFSIKLNITSTK